MKKKEPIPVYLICGFLDSGKTTLIKSMFNDEDFSQGERTLLILCEEGEEEYDAATLKAGNAAVETIEAFERLEGSCFSDFDKKYNPERVVIEYNSVWTLEKLGQIKKPAHWQLGQVVCMADSTTFDLYMTNMRNLMADGLKKADLVIFNRCDENTQKSAFRRMVRAMNPRANIVFDNVDGTSDDGVSDEDLPYDVRADIVEIKDDQYGIFYLDAMEHPDRYNGKTLRMKGLAFDVSDAPKGYYVFGRMAMTCCAADVGPIGFLCRAEKKPSFDQWHTLTCKAEASYSPLHERDCIVLTEQKLGSASKPEKEIVDFNTVI